jgi:hypothetical protein
MMFSNVKPPLHPLPQITRFIFPAARNGGRGLDSLLPGPARTPGPVQPKKIRLLENNYNILMYYK